MAYNTIKGTLIPIGGNEDKGLKPKTLKTFLGKGILHHVLRESGGPGAKMVVIPTASKIPEEVGQNYIDAFKLLGCEDVTVLDIRRKSQSDSKEMLKHIEEANGVMFSGGNQARISSIIGGTKMHDLLQERFTKENFVIAGTSAGAMAMAQEMIAGGSSSESLVKGAVQMSNGLALIPKLIIDTHFVRRGRFGRLAEAVAAFPETIGIGLAEDTGVIIKSNNEFTVIGAGLVMILDPSRMAHNNHAVLRKGTPMSLSNLVTHILANGDKFMLDKRSIKVLPLLDDFV
jgi:cyanophycinase